MLAMAGSSHPMLEAVKASALVFLAVIFIVVFLALYIDARVDANATAPTAETRANTEPVGRLHPRER